MVISVGARPCFLEQLAHELAGRRLVPPALDEDVQDLAFAIHRAPKIKMLPGDPHHHLVEMPMPRRLRATPPKAPGNSWPELQEPTPDRLVGDLEPALGQ